MGFRFQPPVKRVTCDWFPEREGEDPLWADLPTTLTIREYELLRLTSETTIGELMPLIAPHVTAWNAEARDLVTGEWLPVPPPAEAGVDALKTQASVVITWLAVALLRVNSSTSDDDPKADTRPSGATDAPSPSGEQGSPNGSETTSKVANRATNRKSRRASA